ncbi:DUF445 domain-containing protein [Crenobacter caeni]|uniref:DUF445 domain-containing protein n=1 Tax=Crenobacter caeni TaxID=2705474 RepID=A0A6B2KUU7_9NEIS|nr:DUF445 domain-containing protein [Crenobacter caeni]NDV14012.1 DUF445 domain-containing protein [Crenobacter caeni]
MPAWKMSDDDLERRAALGRMKAFALALLFAALALALVARANEGAHPAWGYVAAFAEAATVGALADWFAVVALFRRPFGLPIWHTAIIPRSKARIARNLGSFVVEHFFTAEALTRRLAAINPAARAGEHLADEANAARIARMLSSTLGGLLASPNDAALRGWFSRRLGDALRSGQTVDAIAGLAVAALNGERRQALTTYALGKAADKLADPALREQLVGRLTEVLHLEDVKVMGMSLGGTLRPLARSLAERLIARCAAELSAAHADEHHPWRQPCDDALRYAIGRLQSDAGYRAALARGLAALAGDDAWADATGRLWDALREALLEEVRGEVGERWLAALLCELGARLSADARLQGRINRRLIAVLPGLIEPYRPAIGRFIAEKLDSWSEEEVSERIELAIGRDLQFIRVNGTLVGGLIGLVLYGVSRLLA